MIHCQGGKGFRAGRVLNTVTNRIGLSRSQISNYTVSRKINCPGKVLGAVTSQVGLKFGNKFLKGADRSGVINRHWGIKRAPFKTFLRDRMVKINIHSHRVLVSDNSQFPLYPARNNNIDELFDGSFYLRDNRAHAACNIQKKDDIHSISLVKAAGCQILILTVDCYGNIFAGNRHVICKFSISWGKSYIASSFWIPAKAGIH